MKRKIITKKLDVFTDEKMLISSLLETQNYYRPLDPGSYLYGLVMKYKNTEKYSKKFIELVYTTLSAWNMNSRGARLQEFNSFMKSISKCKSKIENLNRYTLLNIEDENVKAIIQYLFENLDLVFEGKPPLVTFSKTMHFYLPNLFVPVDRTYTIKFFYGNTNIPDSKKNQFKRLWDIEIECCRFAKENKLSQYRDNIWNRSIPKIIDNAIIGYIRKREK